MRKSSKVVIISATSLLLLGGCSRDDLSCLNSNRQVVDAKFCKDEEDKMQNNPRYYAGSSYFWYHNSGSTPAVGSYVPTATAGRTYANGSVPASVAGRSSAFTSISRGGFGATGARVGSVGA